MHNLLQRVYILITRKCCDYRPYLDIFHQVLVYSIPQFTSEELCGTLPPRCLDQLVSRHVNTARLQAVSQPEDLARTQDSSDASRLKTLSLLSTEIKNMHQTLQMFKSVVFHVPSLCLNIKKPIAMEIKSLYVSSSSIAQVLSSTHQVLSALFCGPVHFSWPPHQTLSSVNLSALQSIVFFFFQFLAWFLDQ